MMTDQKCREVLDRYEQRIPEFMDTFRHGKDGELEHLLEMIPKMRAMLDEANSEWLRQRDFVAAADKREKFMRWLGFIQGTLCSQAVYTLEELKNHNRPDA